MPDPLPSMPNNAMEPAVIGIFLRHVMPLLGLQVMLGCSARVVAAE